MMPASITRTRVHSDGSTELYVPHVYGCGHYKVFKRYPDDSAKKASGAIHIQWDQIEGYILQGFSLWMHGNRQGRLGLISPSKIEVA